MNALKLLSLFAFAFFIFSCSNPTTSDFNAKTTDEDTPEALVIDALKNFEEVHEWIIAGKPFGKQNALLKVDQINADSTWIYGDTLTGGIGVVITEKHSYPKGLLLITKNYKYGIGTNEPGNPADVKKIVNWTKKYVSWTQFRDDTPEQEVKTELYSENNKITTHITRKNKNGIVTRESYTFKDPIVTVVYGRDLKIVRKASDYSGDIETLTYQYSTGKLLSVRAVGSAAGDYGDGAFHSTYTEYDIIQPPLRVIRYNKVAVLGKGNGEIWRYVENF
jgi:hypothetical protein